MREGVKEYLFWKNGGVDVQNVKANYDLALASQSKANNSEINRVNKMRYSEEVRLVVSDLIQRSDKSQQYRLDKGQKDAVFNLLMPALLSASQDGLTYREAAKIFREKSQYIEETDKRISDMLKAASKLYDGQPNPETTYVIQLQG